MKKSKKTKENWSFGAGWWGGITVYGAGGTAGHRHSQAQVARRQNRQAALASTYLSSRDAVAAAKSPPRNFEELLPLSESGEGNDVATLCVQEGCSVDAGAGPRAGGGEEVAAQQLRSRRRQDQEGAAVGSRCYDVAG